VFGLSFSDQAMTHRVGNDVRPASRKFGQNLIAENPIDRHFSRKPDNRKTKFNNETELPCLSR